MSRCARTTRAPSEVAAPDCWSAAAERAGCACAAQGVDRWQLKLQRRADKTFDQVEHSALNVFVVPEDLQQVVLPPRPSPLVCMN